MSTERNISILTEIVTMLLQVTVVLKPEKCPKNEVPRHTKGLGLNNSAADIQR